MTERAAFIGILVVLVLLAAVLKVAAVLALAIGDVEAFEEIEAI